jgi:hypothetical protein
MSVIEFPSDKSPVADVDPDDARRAEAYLRMEPHLCDCVKMARIAEQLSVDPDRDLYDFAVHRLAEMLEELEAGYYAEIFQP